MYQINTVVIDSRTGEIGRIHNIEHNAKGVLYTVCMSEVNYRRYYKPKLRSIFIVEHSQNEIKNVVYVDFVMRKVIAS